MSKVIIFSRKYPAYHPRKGEQTFFVEKFLKATYYMYDSSLDPILTELSKMADKTKSEFINNVLRSQPKLHTIRTGHRWKVGDKFSPRVWSGKPYHSKQIIVAPDVTIIKLWDIDIDENGVISINHKYIEDATEKRLTKNDGLSEIDFFHWLVKPCMKKGKPFSGQIICWDNAINYS